MIKIGYPKNFERIKTYFPEKEKEKDLYIMAEDTKTDRVIGVIRFYYDHERLFIYEIQMPGQKEGSLAIFDGILRTLLFRMAEDDYKKVTVYACEDEFKPYFLDHGFAEVNDTLNHDDFPAEFFKPCEGCRE